MQSPGESNGEATPRSFRAAALDELKQQGCGCLILIPAFAVGSLLLLPFGFGDRHLAAAVGLALFIVIVVVVLLVRRRYRRDSDDVDVEKGSHVK